MNGFATNIFSRPPLLHEIQMLRPSCFCSSRARSIHGTDAARSFCGFCLPPLLLAVCHLNAQDPFGFGPLFKKTTQKLTFAFWGQPRTHPLQGREKKRPKVVWCVWRVVRAGSLMMFQVSFPKKTDACDFKSHSNPSPVSQSRLSQDSHEPFAPERFKASQPATIQRPTKFCVDYNRTVTVTTYSLGELNTQRFCQVLADLSRISSRPKKAHGADSRSVAQSVHASTMVLNTSYLRIKGIQTECFRPHGIAKSRRYLRHHA